MKCEKCIVSVSYFIVCFVKTFAKYLRNANYEKCIADLMRYLFIYLLKKRKKKVANLFAKG